MDTKMSVEDTPRWEEKLPYHYMLSINIKMFSGQYIALLPQEKGFLFNSKIESGVTSLIPMYE